MDVTCRLRAALPYWEKGAAIALIVSLGVFLIELTFNLSHHFHQVLKVLEGLIVTIFILEVTMHLLTTDDRITYLKKNWIYILSILPLTAMFRMLRLGRTAQLVRFVKIVDFSKLLRSEQGLMQSLAILSSAPLMKARKALLMGYHFHHADMRKVSPFKSSAFYFDPSLDPNIAEGFLHGYAQYMSTRKKTQPLKREDFGTITFTENALTRNRRACAAAYLKKIDTILRQGSIVITSASLDSPIRTNSFLSTNNNLVISVDREITKEEDDAGMTFRLGELLAYNALGHANEPCFDHTCICSNHDHRSLMNLCRRTYGGYIPLCDYHASRWPLNKD